MSVFTLSDFIQSQKESDPEFASQYAREEIINNIAEMIINARKSGSLTQTQLAERIGTKQSVISRIESGKSSYVPSLDTLLKIAFAMGMKLKLQLKH